MFLLLVQFITHSSDLLLGPSCIHLRQFPLWRNFNTGRGRKSLGLARVLRNLGEGNPDRSVQENKLGLLLSLSLLKLNEVGDRVARSYKGEITQASSTPTWSLSSSSKINHPSNSNNFEKEMSIKNISQDPKRDPRPIFRAKMTEIPHLATLV